MKKIIISVICILIALPLNGLVNAQIVKPKDPRSVGSKVELSINDEGKVVVHGLEVLQVSGTTFFTRLQIGSASLRFTVTSKSSIPVEKRYGGKTESQYIKSGDILSVEGDFVSGTDSMMIVAKSIKDWSIQEEGAVYSGKIKSIDRAENTFILTLKDASTINVVVGTSTEIIKGNLRPALSELSVGETILSTSGVYNFPTKTLKANRVKVYQDSSRFISKNWDATLKEGSVLKTPTMITVLIDGKEYRVYLKENAEIYNKKREKVPLGRFLSGDALRFYGSLRESDQTAIDSDVIRNLSL